MEKSTANKLPEADSLPDGFVESKASEPFVPQTPMLDQEKPLSESKDSNMENPSHSINSVNQFESQIHSDESEIERAEKLRSFPVQLSEKDTSDGSEATLKLNEGCSDTQVTSIKEMPSSESNEVFKNKKLETSEVKRKNTKRTFKSEKEFIEFTLKYQQVLAERDAAIAVRDKLESLCRELQRQNKMLMDECKRVSAEGQNLRLDLSTKFHDAIKDVSNKLEEQKDECLSQLKENETLRNKLKQLADQYALSEQQFVQKLKQKTLELQIADLKIQQHEDKLAHEQAQIKLYAEQVSQLLATEKNLRLQLMADGEKFQQFQMSKSIKELKKENTFLKGKCEKSDITLIELVEEREHLKKQLEKTKNQKEKLESLCRSLQAERKQNPAGSQSSESVAN
ncbi:Taxilin family [Dillenia turbinata]|uniref:Taxilin family n=1 Tax=Dillenia turbinata TaxID=194707 RepID=A0AAN8VE04_9MAGN